MATRSGSNLRAGGVTPAGVVALAGITVLVVTGTLLAAGAPTAPGAPAATRAPTKTKSPAATGATPSRKLLTYESTALGLRFSYPEGFQVGRYKQEPLPPKAKKLGMEQPFKNAVVLVEPGQLGRYPVAAIPIGEVPDITVDLQTGEEAKLTREEFFKDESKVTIGKRLAYKPPGFPGPYGDQAFYYLVPAPNGAVVEIMAHRYYFGEATEEELADETDEELAAEPKEESEAQKETHYDLVIETIIKSLKLRGE